MTIFDSGDVTPYTFESHEVRVMLMNDAPWWVLNDVAAAVEIANPRDVVKRLDIRDVDNADVPDSNGHTQATTIINESGLYDMIFTSRKEAAKRFKRWVTNEVLPEIRKTGTYGLGKIDLPTALELYAKALREKDAASARAVEAETYATELQPKAIEWDHFMKADGLCDMGALAQALGGGRTRLINRLRELKILVSEAGSQLGGVRPMQRYAELGWLEVKIENTPGGAKYVTYVTPRGVSEVFRMLVKHGVGEHRWGGLPTEEELFQKVSFAKDLTSPEDQL